MLNNAVIEQVSGEVVAAVASFFNNSDGPKHSSIGQALAGAGLSDGYDPLKKNRNKQQRVISAFDEVEPENCVSLMEGLLKALYEDGFIFTESAPSERETQLKRALASQELCLTEDASLVGLAEPQMNSGGRPNLQRYVERLRSCQGDVEQSLGCARELLEATAKAVIEELAPPVDCKKNFNQNLTKARELLKILPARGEQNEPWQKSIQTIHQSLWNIAESIRDLRNSEGPAHGSSDQSRVPLEMARFVAREAASISEYMVRCLDTAKPQDDGSDIALQL